MPKRSTTCSVAALKPAPTVPPSSPRPSCKRPKESFPRAPAQVAVRPARGRVSPLAVPPHDPAGKALDDCQKVTVRLTLDAGQDDFQIRACRGVIALRRARLLRLAAEAREQGGG